jgi:hypothetical protein
MKKGRYWSDILPVKNGLQQRVAPRLCFRMCHQEGPRKQGKKFNSVGRRTFCFAQFLGTFKNYEKRLLPWSCLSVRLYVHIEQLCSHWTDFNEILYLSIFRKCVQKIQVSLKHDRNNGYRTWKSIYIYDHISLSSSSNEKCFRQNF